MLHRVVTRSDHRHLPTSSYCPTPWALILRAIQSKCASTRPYCSMVQVQRHALGGPNYILTGLHYQGCQARIIITCSWCMRKEVIRACRPTGVSVSDQFARLHMTYSRSHYCLSWTVVGCRAGGGTSIGEAAVVLYCKTDRSNRDQLVGSIVF